MYLKTIDNTYPILGVLYLKAFVFVTLIAFLDIEERHKFYHSPKCITSTPNSITLPLLHMHMLAERYQASAHLGLYVTCIYVYMI